MVASSTSVLVIEPRVTATARGTRLGGGTAPLSPVAALAGLSANRHNATAIAISTTKTSQRLI